MRKTVSLPYLALLTLTSLGSGCTKPASPAQKRIDKVWTARQVDQNGTTVYSRGAVASVNPAYMRWKLDLSAPPVASYTDVDGSVFIGQYAVPTDNTLTLTALAPQPKATDGTMVFTINALEDNTLTLTNQVGSGYPNGTTTVYALTNP